MNVREMEYLSELVLRDGDKRLQARYGIFDRLDVAKKLRGIAEIARIKDQGATHFAVFKDCDWAMEHDRAAPRKPAAPSAGKEAK